MAVNNTQNTVSKKAQQTPAAPKIPQAPQFPGSNYRILAKGCYMNNDTWVTKVNNNDLVIGPAGAGKTRSYVKPNLMQCDHSVIVADTKGSLIQEVGPLMKERGFEVINVDLATLRSPYGYNPLAYIRKDSKTGRYSEKDILSVAACLCPVETDRDPFWEKSAQMYVACMIGYVLEALPENEHSLEYVRELFSLLQTDAFTNLMDELETEDPMSFAARQYHLFCDAKRVEKTFECIRMFIAERLNPLTFSDLLEMYRNPRQVDFKALGRKKTAVFLTVSDTDRSLDVLATLFYTQAFQALCDSADNDYENHRLPVPVRLILDDFATNVQIPDFDNIISVIRSREIYVSVILQSLSQLNAIYGDAKAKTIFGNCDNCLYLGGQDEATARYISVRAGKTLDTIMALPRNCAYLLTRGDPAKKVEQFDITSHPLYNRLPEAQPRQKGGQKTQGETAQPV